MLKLVVLLRRSHHHHYVTQSLPWANFISISVHSCCQPLTLPFHLFKIKNIKRNLFRTLSTGYQLICLWHLSPLKQSIPIFMFSFNALNVCPTFFHRLYFVNKLWLLYGYQTFFTFIPRIYEGFLWFFAIDKLFPLLSFFLPLRV